MRRPVVSWFAAARVAVALLTRRNTLPVAPWLTAPIVVSVRGRKGIGGARSRMCSPCVVPQHNMTRVLHRSSGVSAAIAVILGVSLRTVAGRSRVRTMACACRGGAIAIIGSPVRIRIGPSVIGGPTARIAEIGRPSALAAAIAVEVRTRHRAAATGSCTPPASAVRSHLSWQLVMRQFWTKGQPFLSRRAPLWGKHAHALHTLHPKTGLSLKPPPRASTGSRKAARWMPLSRSAKRNETAHRHPIIGVSRLPLLLLAVIVVTGQ